MTLQDEEELRRWIVPPPPSILFARAGISLLRIQGESLNRCVNFLAGTSVSDRERGLWRGLEKAMTLPGTSTLTI